MENFIKNLKGFTIESHEIKKPNYGEDIYQNQILDFCVEDNTVLYFDLEYNPVVCDFLNDNYDEICDNFKNKDFHFVFFPKIKLPWKIENIINFYNPYLNNKLSNQLRFGHDQLLKMEFLNLVPLNKKLIFTFYKVYYQRLLDSLGYKGDIKSGFILFNNANMYIIEYGDKEVDYDYSSLKSFFESFPIKKQTDYDDDIFESPRNFTKSSFIKAIDKELDEEARHIIEEFTKDLEIMKSSGQLLFALPILKNIISKQFQNIDSNNISPLHISEDYSITLPGFGNLEIPLSSLTKVVYILFYNHPEGINIKELNLYEEEIKSLYTNISNQLDYDKIIQSIDDLVNPESKAIYTHLSRIKSTFYKLMDEEYAENYIIKGSGYGSEIKGIPAIQNTIKNEDDLSNKSVEDFLDSLDEMDDVFS